MPKGFRLLIIVLFCACSGNAQQLSIRGVLQDANDKIAVIGATILLFQDKDSVSRTNAISDKTGTFIINTPGPGTYTLRISSVGYGNVEKTAVIRDSSTDLGIIAFAKEAKLLDEVIVQAAMPPVRQKGDTLEYRANAFKVNPDANAEDLVRKMPGITVDQGTVKAGERISKRSLLTEEIFLATTLRRRLKTFLPK